MYVVRGDVADPSVLLQGTLTNARGQVIATSYTHVLFPGAPSVRPAFAQPFATAAEAVAALRLAEVNTGGVPGAAAWGALIPVAVDEAQAMIGNQVAAIEAATRDRIEAWRARSSRWQQQAARETQRSTVRQRTAMVAAEEDLAASMNPERTLIRPLLVVVPPGDLSDLTPGDLPPAI